MGWYFRKSVNFGPLRLNASKSGLGVSVGVPGMRVGSGPRGNYITMGRGGVYYRQNFPSKLRRPSAGAPTAPHAVPAPASAGLGAYHVVAAGDVTQMDQGSSTALLAELNRVQARIPRVWIALALCAGALLFTLQAPLALRVLVLGTGSVAVFAAVISDQRHGVARLVYDLEPSVALHYDELRRGLTAFAQCELVRHTVATADVYDAKRNAGATQSLQANAVRPRDGAPRRVECNVRVPMIPAGAHTLYFFPDRLLVYERDRVGAIRYGDVAAAAGVTQFIEEETPPRDASVVGQTWRFVNNGGGPDRRFNNNRQLPIMRYGTLEITGSGGLRHRFHCSQPAHATSAAAAINNSRRTLHQP